MKFGTYLCIKREERELSAKELAEMVGVSNTYISKIERGVKPPPSGKIIRRLASALEVPEDEMLTVSQDNSGVLARLVEESNIEQLIKAATHSHDLLEGYKAMADGERRELIDEYIQLIRQIKDRLQFPRYPEDIEGIAERIIGLGDECKVFIQGQLDLYEKVFVRRKDIGEMPQA